MTDEMPASYARRVGQRLRSVRRQQRLSLQAVEAASREEFKASVLGAYERGERAISVPRLQRLASFYHVPVDQLLPKTGAQGGGRSSEEEIDLRDEAATEKVTIDLTRIDEGAGDEAAMLGRYLSTIQLQRQDFNGRVLTIREEDLRAISCLLDTQPEMIRHRLEELGVRA